ncbi:MAG: hypothetical protein WCJ30_26760 [Deltaproteobacteria bacterium]
MVVAGVFLVARLYPVFHTGLDINVAGNHFNLIAVIGGITILVAAGLALGLAAATEFITAVPCAVIGLWLVRGDGPGALRRVLALALGALAPLAVVAGYNTACFGAPWRTGYSFVTNPVFVAGHARGLMGISWPRPDALALSLFGPSRGLCVLAPVSVFGLAGLVVTMRRADRTPRAFAIALAALLVVNAGYYMWWGGASTGPRHVVPVFAALSIGIAECLARPRWRAVVWLAGIASVLSMAGFASVGVEAPERVDALTGYLWPHLARGDLASLAGASNLGIELGFSRGGSLGLLLAWWLVGGQALMARARG